MRSALYRDPDPAEIHDWYESINSGATSRVGIAVLVADRGDGSLAGFIEVGSRQYAEGCETSPVAYIEGWYVDADVRRTGVGTRLIQAAGAWALDNGFSELASDTELHNDTSLKAHLASGFEEVERLIGFRKSLC
jgi:aminoglycoside 6'-N-acetyltransferase I